MLFTPESTSWWPICQRAMLCLSFNILFNFKIQIIKHLKIRNFYIKIHVYNSLKFGNPIDTEPVFSHVHSWLALVAADPVRLSTYFPLCHSLWHPGTWPAHPLSSCLVTAGIGLETSDLVQSPQDVECAKESRCLHEHHTTKNQLNQCSNLRVFPLPVPIYTNAENFSLQHLAVGIIGIVRLRYLTSWIRGILRLRIWIPYF